MNTNNVDYLKALLIKNRHDLHLSAEKTFTEMKTDEKQFPDPYDRATVELGRSVDLIMRSRERELIREIEEALTRIDRGEFGICQTCGRPISEKRLWAKPTSLLCIECKEKEEGRQRSRSVLNSHTAVSSHSSMAW
ncbi:MAG: TraR/DksA C4-type zinc finger protein [Syntrophales bacterium]|nr:TraR/DksA C4-type zinc finger protein [Syntrophales bacterium]